MLLKPKKKKHYVNNKDFYEAFVEYRKKADLNENTKIPDYIGICIMQICEKLASKPNFSSYTYKEEMISDAVENCIVAINGFNPEKSNNPFSYFTQVAWNAFIRRITKEQKENYVKHKNMQRMHIFDEEIFLTIDNEASDNIIETFEKKLTKNKKTAKMGIEKFIEEESDI